MAGPTQCIHNPIENPSTYKSTQSTVCLVLTGPETPFHRHCLLLPVAKFPHRSLPFSFHFISLHVTSFHFISSKFIRHLRRRNLPHTSKCSTSHWLHRTIPFWWLTFSSCVMKRAAILIGYAQGTWRQRLTCGPSTGVIHHRHNATNVNEEDWHHSSTFSLSHPPLISDSITHQLWNK